MKRNKQDDPFRKATEFINGKQTERQPVGGTIPSPPTVPGEYLKNRQADVALFSVTQNDPSYPVDSDLNPVVQPPSMDVNGYTRVICKFTGTQTVTVSGAVVVHDTGTVTVTGTVSVAGAVTVHDTGTVTVTGTVSASLVGTPTVAVSGTVAVSASITGTATVTVSGAVAVHDTSTATVTVAGTVSVDQTSVNTYSASGTQSPVAVTASTQPYFVLQNTATASLTIRVRFVQTRIATNSTNTVGCDVIMYIRNALSTVNSGTTLTNTPHDSNNPTTVAQAILVNTWTATALGNEIRRTRGLNFPGNINPPQNIQWDFRNHTEDQAPTLHVNQELQLVSSSITPTQTASVSIEWTQESS